MKDTQTTVEAMQAASKVLAVEQKKIDVDKIEDMQDDLTEMMEEMNEVNEALGRSYEVGDEIDEAVGRTCYGTAVARHSSLAALATMLPRIWMRSWTPWGMNSTLWVKMMP